MASKLATPIPFKFKQTGSSRLGTVGSHDTSSVPTLHKNGTTANSKLDKATLLGQLFFATF